MDIQAQKEAIIARLAGARYEDLPHPAGLDEPWRTIYLRITRAGSRSEAESLIAKATANLPGGRRLADELVDLVPGDEAFTPYPSLHEVSSWIPPVDWLWPSWIPRGLLTLFGAAPGMGKSLVALDLARRLIHGEPLPDGAPVPRPGCNVLVVDAEGSPALLNQRAQAWNMDLRHLFLFAPSGSHRVINLADPQQGVQLVRMVGEVQPALIVIDSLAAATTRGETSLEGARDLLNALAALAARTQVAVLLIHHLRKRGRFGNSATAPRVAAEDLRGSSYLSAAARSVLALSIAGSAPPAASLQPPATAAWQPGFAGLRRLEVVKTNLCSLPPPLALAIVGEDVRVPTLRYSSLAEPPPVPDQVDLCARWLLDFMAAAGGPVKPRDAVQAAAMAGFSRNTVYRARQGLAGWVVDAGRGPRDPGKRWRLAAADDER
jgi:AAA domain